MLELILADMHFLWQLKFNLQTMTALFSIACNQKRYSGESFSFISLANLFLLTNYPSNYQDKKWFKITKKKTTTCLIYLTIVSNVSFSIYPQKTFGIRPSPFPTLISFSLLSFLPLFPWLSKKMPTVMNYKTKNKIDVQGFYLKRENRVKFK